MALHNSDRAALDKLSSSIERLTIAIDALADVLRERVKLIEDGGDFEMETIRRLSKLVGGKAGRPARRRAT